MFVRFRKVELEMNKNLLILCDSAYGTAAKEIALSMGCFEKVDVLNQHFGDRKLRESITK